MKTKIILAAGVAALACAAIGVRRATGLCLVASAVADDKNRPDADTKRDARAASRPRSRLEFSGIKPGAKVLELLPSRGYFTRVFAKAVGANGHIYAASPTVNPETGAAVPPFALASDAAYGNITQVPLTFSALTAPEPVDVIFTGRQNYHDLHLPGCNSRLMSWASTSCCTPT